jgi:hypothetical protein
LLCPIHHAYMQPHNKRRRELYATESIKLVNFLYQTSFS